MLLLSFIHSVFRLLLIPNLRAAFEDSLDDEDILEEENLHHNQRESIIDLDLNQPPPDSNFTILLAICIFFPYM